MEIKEVVLPEEKQAVKVFLEKNQLRYNDDIEYTIYIKENNRIIATASTVKDIIKAIAIDEDYRGYNLTSKLISYLINYFQTKRIYHYKIFTKIENEKYFETFGLQVIARTDLVVLMESKHYGIKDKLKQIKVKYNIPNQDYCALVLNANPFTNGHRYLVEKAQEYNDGVLIFVVEEDKSMFSFAERLLLVKEGVADLKNIYVVPSTEYLVSNLTFPNYFIKDDSISTREETLLDAIIFMDYFVKEFSIIKRLLGSETDIITLKYNTVLKEILGDLIIEIPRKRKDDIVISASLVRKLYQERNFKALEKIVPETTLEYLKQR